MRCLCTQALQKRKQQPATHAPGHAKAAVELGGAGVQATVDVHLLVGGGAVAAVLFGTAVQRGFHTGQDLSGQLATACGVKGQGGASGHQGQRQVFHEAGRSGVAHIAGALRFKQRRLRWFAHNVDQANAVLKADPVQHLPQVRCRRRMHQRRVPFQPHGLHHAQCRQRIDKTRSAIARRRAFGQHQALLDLDAAVLRIHGAAQYGHRLAQQRLRRRRAAGRHNHTRPFVAHRQRLPQPTGHALHGSGRNLHADHRMGGRVRQFGGGNVTRTKQQANVRRVDGRGFYAHHHFIGGGLGRGQRDQRNLQHALGFDQRLQLQAGEMVRVIGCCHIYLRLNL